MTDVFAAWRAARINFKLVSIIVLGHLVSSSPLDGGRLLCTYDSLYGQFAITVHELRGCPMTFSMRMDL